MSDFQCFLRPMGALEDRRVRQISDLHRDCGVGIHHKQTSREFKIRLKHWGCLLRKPVCSWVIILPGKLWFNNLWPLKLWTQIEKNVLMLFFCWDFSLSGDVLHRCPCLLWALLINKTRLSLGDLLLALKSVCVCVCVRESGVVLSMCQRRKAQGPAVMNEQ